MERFLVVIFLNKIIKYVIFCRDFFLLELIFCILVVIYILMSLMMNRMEIVLVLVKMEGSMNVMKNFCNLLGSLRVV